eukprot:2220988-Rhodomonas_salina.2
MGPRDHGRVGGWSTDGAVGDLGDGEELALIGPLDMSGGRYWRCAVSHGEHVTSGGWGVWFGCREGWLSNRFDSTSAVKHELYSALQVGVMVFS